MEIKLVISTIRLRPLGLFLSRKLVINYGNPEILASNVASTSCRTRMKVER
jgi:hypothetical protein